MTLRYTPDPRRRGSQPSVDQPDERDPELRRCPTLIASGDGRAGLDSHPRSLGTGVPSPEAAVAGRW
jgi:hypothetical protein